MLVSTIGCQYSLSMCLSLAVVERSCQIQKKEVETLSRSLSIFYLALSLWRLSLSSICLKAMLGSVIGDAYSICLALSLSLSLSGCLTVILVSTRGGLYALFLYLAVVEGSCKVQQQEVKTLSLSLSLSLSLWLLKSHVCFNNTRAIL